MGTASVASTRAVGPAAIVAARCVGAVAVVATLLYAGPAFAKSPPSGTGGAGFGIVPLSPSGGAHSSAGSHSATGGDSAHLGDRTLREGMHGHDVRVLQAYLTVAGFGAVVDGDFGPDTLQSVIEFEQTHGLNANGVVTYAQSQVLRQTVAVVEASPPMGKVRINADGTATAPTDAPAVVQQMVAAANRITDTSYCVGGGHGSWNSSCYDCSGSVSYVLHHAGLLPSSEDSTGLESYGEPGPGKWVTIYADAGHAFIVIGGRAFDTADYGGPNIPSGTGPRWRSDPTGNLADGGNYIVRHPGGL